MATEAPLYDVSPVALKALTDTFWGPEGWKNSSGKVPHPVPQVALVAGLMFPEPRRLDHDGWVAAARAAVAATDLDDVAQAFLSSLTSRRLDLRSALGSFAVARHLPDHPYTPGADSKRCHVCDLYPDVEAVDPNVLNFERFKWGGVAHDELTYLTLDLELFARAPRLSPSPADISAGRELLDALRTASPAATVAQLARTLTALRGNKDDRRSLLEILALSGILTAPGHPGFREGFIDAADREPAPGDTAYPACWWRGADGVDEQAVAEFLPALT
ncbi:MAG: hypothetical protein WAR57_07395 [Candidatus Phosphoribacter sp.]|nr:hypothetical protein [Actinomycetales bacterium]